MKNIQRIKRQSLRDEVYHHLRDAILSLELEPEERLNDKDLAEQFGISRTPVREALKRLEDEGLVEAMPGSATRVAPLHKEEAKHAFTLVAALHALAARLAVPGLEKDNIQKLKECNQIFKRAIEEKNVSRAIEADEMFHEVFLVAAGNPELRKALETCTAKIRRLEMAQFGSLKGIKSVEQHEQIISACIEKDREKTAQLTEKNWLSLGELLTQE
ncbi:GntR family transcriptional regulator [Fictibacillus sp. NE201]|uniref:GntR family transcriptional regulator n=2 Tax=Fictibacillus fluitans TaxID=3058422 RepID=A0ABT8HUQ3_9BACL|nr:GntR family transcriptional regulator [Fictibacillus sp. NE201]MDN4524501.1 GntR family transcriptional regulator [Fictibacillus sp. NE201]